MKKLSNIDESVWADIHKRSNGSQDRKEDNLTNTTNLKKIIPIDLHCSVLWADRDLEYNDGSYYFDFNEVNDILKKSEWRLPTQNEVTELFINASIIKATTEECIIADDNKSVSLTFYKHGYQTDFNKVFDEETYCFWTSTKDHTDSDYHIFGCIKRYMSLYTSNDKNRLCVRLVKDKSSSIDESVWADIHRRSNGTQERKEDSIDSFDEENFWEYLNKTYISKEPSRDIISYPIDNVISIPFVCDGLYYNFYIEYNIGKDEIKYITIPDRFISFYENIENTFKLNMHPHEDNRVCICPKDGTDITNSFAVKVIDFLLDTKDKKTYGLFIKKERS